MYANMHVTQIDERERESSAATRSNKAEGWLQMSENSDASSEGRLLGPREQRFDLKEEYIRYCFF